jgi:hypothetical protein
MIPVNIPVDSYGNSQLNFNPNSGNVLQANWNLVSTDPVLLVKDKLYVFGTSYLAAANETRYLSHTNDRSLMRKFWGEVFCQSGNLYLYGPHFINVHKWGYNSTTYQEPFEEANVYMDPNQIRFLMISFVGSINFRILT